MEHVSASMSRLCFPRMGHLFVMYDNFTCSASKPRLLTQYLTPEKLRAA